MFPTCLHISCMGNLEVLGNSVLGGCSLPRSPTIFSSSLSSRIKTWLRPNDPRSENKTMISDLLVFSRAQSMPLKSSSTRACYVKITPSPFPPTLSSSISGSPDALVASSPRQAGQWMANTPPECLGLCFSIFFLLREKAHP